MVSLYLHVTVIAVLIAAACVLPGVFLVLRGVALMSDAISHAILPGIALMFLLVKDLNSVWLLVGAAGAGIATVIGTESIIQTQRVKKETAIGLLFPLFFSLGVIIISKYTRMFHLDTDMVLLGELAFAPFDRLICNGYDCGARGMWIGIALLIINSTFIIGWYKQLTVSTFDPLFAHVSNARPSCIYYMLMVLTSITAVGSFTSVGSIIVVALMVAPAATAYLLTHRLHDMIITSICFACAGAIGGCGLATLIDGSLPGSIAVVHGVMFLSTLIGAPEKGLFAAYLHHRQYRMQHATTLLCQHLASAPSAHRMTVDIIARECNWSLPFTQRVIDVAERNGLVEKTALLYTLKSSGKSNH